jgi:probable rRNA maturation factor
MTRAAAATRPAPARLRMDVVVDTRLWREIPKVRTLVRRTITAAAATLSTTTAELAIVLTDDSTVRSLNRLWRGIDAATNVLSFPTKAAGGEPRHLGDIVLAYETIAREASDERKPIAHHVAHLVLHGFLHLLGYDHEQEADAERMEQAERNVLRRLAIPDPYRRCANA